MRKLVYYVGTSIDGYIAGPRHEVDFFPVGDDVLSWIRSEYPETLPTHLRREMGVDAPNRRFDTVIMGRGTYQPALDIGITSPYQHLRQFVVSTTIDEIADAEVEHVAGDPRSVVSKLQGETGMDIWLAGGGVLASSLLSEIDELVVKRYPVVAGAGIPMFAGRFQPLAFEPTDTLGFESGAVVTTYRRRAERSVEVARPSE